MVSLGIVVTVAAGLVAPEACEPGDFNYCLIFLGGVARGIGLNITGVHVWD